MSINIMPINTEDRNNTSDPHQLTSDASSLLQTAMKNSMKSNRLETAQRALNDEQHRCALERSIESYKRETEQRALNDNERTKIAVELSLEQKRLSDNESRLMALAMNRVMMDTAKNGTILDGCEIARLDLGHTGNCLLEATDETYRNIRSVFRNCDNEEVTPVTRRQLVAELKRDVAKRCSMNFVPCERKIGVDVQLETYKEFGIRMLSDGQFCEAPCVQALANLYSVKILIRVIYYGTPDSKIRYQEYQSASRFYPMAELPYGETKDGTPGIVLVLLENRHKAPHYVGLANVT